MDDVLSQKVTGTDSDASSARPPPVVAIATGGVLSSKAASGRAGEEVGKRAADSIRQLRSEFKVADISLDQPDIEGRSVEEVYARSKHFAIYRAAGGDVWVQLSDDITEADKQRTALAKIAELRWDIDQAADGWWREPHSQREIAAGIQLALIFGPDTAVIKLSRTLATLKDERQLAGRIQYMGLAACSTVLLLGALYTCSELRPFADPATNVWLAGKAGLMGAFFSIAMAIRGRKVACDNGKISNAMEGAVRLIIGVIASGFLLLAIGSGFLTRAVMGEAPGSGVANWQAVVVLGFLAGFIERLVPSLLEEGADRIAAATPLPAAGQPVGTAAPLSGVTN